MAQFICYLSFGYPVHVSTFHIRINWQRNGIMKLCVHLVLLISEQRHLPNCGIAFLSLPFQVEGMFTSLKAWGAAILLRDDPKKPQTI